MLKILFVYIKLMLTMGTLLITDSLFLDLYIKSNKFRLNKIFKEIRRKGYSKNQ